MKSHEKQKRPQKQKIKGAGRKRVSRTHKPLDLELEEWQRLLRKQFAETQNYRLKNIGKHPFFSEFSLANPESGGRYRIAIRGGSYGDNYCSCPDFSINNLGTCKHVEFVLSHLMKKRGSVAAFRQGYVPPFSEVYVSYGLRREVRFRAGSSAPPGLLTLAYKFFDPSGVLKEDLIPEFPVFLKAAQKSGHELRCYDDVMSYISERTDAARRSRICDAYFSRGIESPIFTDLLKTELYPYQREGALFAARAGRCLIGDDMGLGKTVQALAAVELMAKMYGIGKTLIVAPTSLKHQWRTEIGNFSGRTAEVVEGAAYRRRRLYRTASFFKIINYEILAPDLEIIRNWKPDLIILDEAQRIKNWKTRTAQTVKRLESPFAIVLTGTPIENRIEELHSILEFIDRRRLGPLYRFVHMHRITDEGGKVVGYRDLQSIREALKGVLIRRKKGEVLEQLPGRSDKNFFVRATEQQAVIHEENAETVARIAAKWRRYKFLSDADQRRLQIALLMMRMVSDNTYLVDKETFHGPKITELETLIGEIVIEGGEKAVIFSQWLRMTGLIERMLEKRKIGYAHLNGSVPSQERRKLMTRFREDPECKVFLSTDAGGVGLNLQSGSVVINMDIPWNPAVLEQRIGRVHRLGQKRPVRVINFVTSGSIEERMLDLLKFKKSVFTGALDREGEDVVMLGGSQFKRFMESVESVTEPVEKTSAAPAAVVPDKDVDRRGRREAGQIPRKQAGRDAVSVSGKTEMAGLGELIKMGAQVLTDLGKALDQGGKVGGTPLPPMIDKDNNTGRSYLKLPVPEPDTLNKILSILGDFASKIKLS